MKYYLAYDGNNVIYSTFVPDNAVLLRSDAFDSLEELIEFVTWQMMQVKKHKVKIPLCLQEAMTRFLFKYHPVKSTKMKMCHLIFD